MDRPQNITDSIPDTNGIVPPPFTTCHTVLHPSPHTYTHLLPMPLIHYPHLFCRCVRAFSYSIMGSSFFFFFLHTTHTHPTPHPTHTHTHTPHPHPTCGWWCQEGCPRPTLPMCCRTPWCGKPPSYCALCPCLVDCYAYTHVWISLHRTTVPPSQLLGFGHHTCLPCLHLLHPSHTPCPNHAPKRLYSSGHTLFWCLGTTPCTFYKSITCAVYILPSSCLNTHIFSPVSYSHSL